MCKNHTFHAALIHKAYVWGVNSGNTENVIPISFPPREFQLPIVVYNWMTKKLTRKITISQIQQKSQKCDVELQTAISVKLLKKSGDFSYNRRILVHVETWNEIIPNKRWNLWTLKGRPQIISNKAAKFFFHSTPTIDLIWAFTSPFNTWKIGRFFPKFKCCQQPNLGFVSLSTFVPFDTWMTACKEKEVTINLSQLFLKQDTRRSLTFCLCCFP